MTLILNKEVSQGLYDLLILFSTSARCGLHPIGLGVASNTRFTVRISYWLMLSFSQLVLSRPQLYTNTQAKKQRQDVEDSCMELTLISLHKATKKKQWGKSLTVSIITFHLVIFYQSKCGDLLLSFSKSQGSKVKVSPRIGIQSGWSLLDTDAWISSFAKEIIHKDLTSPIRSQNFAKAHVTLMQMPPWVQDRKK